MEYVKIVVMVDVVRTTVKDRVWQCLEEDVPIVKENVNLDAGIIALGIVVTIVMVDVIVHAPEIVMVDVIVHV